MIRRYAWNSVRPVPVPVGFQSLGSEGRDEVYACQLRSNAQCVRVFEWASSVDAREKRRGAAEVAYSHDLYIHPRRVTLGPTPSLASRAYRDGRMRSPGETRV